MGMLGSETALEELTCCVVGDLLKKGVVAKLADDLYCGSNTVDELLHNWRLVLQPSNLLRQSLSHSQMISYGLLQMVQSRNTVLAPLFMSLAMVVLGSLDFLVPSCVVASLHGCHVKSKHCLSQLQSNILVLSLFSLVIMLASWQTVNHVYKLMRSFAVASFQQAPHISTFLSTVSRYQASVRTSRVQLISPLILLVAMPLIVSMLIAKYVHLWNAKRSQLSFVYQLKMSYRVMPNSPLLAEVPDVQIWGDAMPT